jgi:site-specific recombinase XerD
MNIQDALDEFLLDGQARRLSPKTLGWYEDLLGQARDFLEGEMQVESVEKVRSRDLRRFIAKLNEQGLKPCSVSAYFRAVRAFFNWLAEESIVSDNPVQRLSPPRTPRRIPPSIPPEVIRRLMKACANTPMGARNQAIIMTLWDTGIRVGELVGLTLDDLFLGDAYIVVIGKGDKEREVPIGQVAIGYLKKWLDVRPVDDGSDRVFLNLRTCEGLKRRGVSLMLKRIQQRAEVEQRIYPHLFRHSFARQFLLGGGDPITLQQILGHSSQEMVKRYVRFTARELVMQHQRSSPGNRLFSAGLSS